MTIDARTPALAALGLVNQAALGLAASTRLAAGTGEATGTASHLNLDLLRRVVTRDLQPDQCTRRSRLAITAIAAIGTATCLRDELPAPGDVDLTTGRAFLRVDGVS